MQIGEHASSELLARGAHDEDNPYSKWAKLSHGMPDHRMGTERRPHLIDTLHSAAGACCHDDKADRRTVHSRAACFGSAKIMRPATVWSTRVTTMSISQF